MNQKIWYITGISSGLGKALANAVMEKGDFVIGTFRNSTQVEAFNSTHKGKGFAVKLDITKHEEIDQTTTILLEKFKRIDVLVNNAGIGFVGAIEEASIQEVRNVFEANFFGVLKLTQSILPFMRKENKGHIVQISSHGGIKAFAGFGIYNASKFALEGFSEALAQEVAALGINVSIIEPGPFRTNFASSTLGEAQKTIEAYDATAGTFRTKLKSVHGKQEGNPKKAAQAIIQLVSSEKPPLRLPLGKIALMTIKMKLESVQSDLESGRSIAENAVYE
ncbi:SDR family NAD(P)-dependent oxidoreductase [Kordia sp. TARA_039_SRF]|nr:SDR family NAD(P)-dependent oxidoreductase [Kordia sp. TARA_039_SRF]